MVEVWKFEMKVWRRKRLVIISIKWLRWLKIDKEQYIVIATLSLRTLTITTSTCMDGQESTCSFLLITYSLYSKHKEKKGTRNIDQSRLEFFHTNRIIWKKKKIMVWESAKGQRYGYWIEISVVLIREETVDWRHDLGWTSA